MQFKNYIQSLFIPDFFKVQILDKNFIDNNPIYYQNYPSLFAKSFSVHQKDFYYNFRSNEIRINNLLQKINIRSRFLLFFSLLILLLQKQPLIIFLLQF